MFDSECCQTLLRRNTSPVGNIGWTSSSWRVLRQDSQGIA